MRPRTAGEFRRWASMSRISILLVLASVLIAGCGLGSPLWMTDRAHENFLDRIRVSVGRSASRPDFSWNRYPARRGEVRKLSNGNDEYEYFWGGHDSGKCIVYWEVDTRSDIVVAVRFDGTPDTCYLVP